MLDTRSYCKSCDMLDFVIAFFLCVLAGAALAVAAFAAPRHKHESDPSTGQLTEMEIPGLGRFKSNTPAVALCFLGVVLGYFAYDSMKNRRPKLVKFQGTIALDQEVLSGIDVVTVGVTSGSWSHTTTPNGSTPEISVEIPVPDSWPTYAAYAFAMGSTKTRPVLIGAKLENPKFHLSIRK